MVVEVTTAKQLNSSQESKVNAALNKFLKEGEAANGQFKIEGQVLWVDRFCGETLSSNKFSPLRRSVEDDEKGGPGSLGRDDCHHRGQVHRHVAGQEVEEIHGIDQAADLSFSV